MTVLSSFLRHFRTPLIPAALPLGLLLFILTGAAPGQHQLQEQEPADIIQARYDLAIRDFAALTPTFRTQVATLPATPAGTAALRREVVRLRAAYKRMEFLLDYVHPGSSVRLNPPPLNRSDMTSPDAVTVLPPEGLQILLEVAYEDDPLGAHREHLAWIAMRLEEAVRELTEAQSPVLDDRMVFEALQNQVIRVMATGITGFDAPATQHALPESRISLESLRPVLALYLKDIRRRDAALAKRVHTALNRAIAALPTRVNDKSFETFDRLAFIRRAGNPLYAALVDAHHTLNIATFDDLAPLRRPVSTTARNLFAPDFLDAHYYSLTPGERMDTTIAALGQKLFFDPALSGRSLSCATCHDPRRAFSDGVPKSASPGGGTLLRNSPGLSHAAYQGAQFWDLRAPTLEMQVNHVVHGDLEFASDFLSAKNRLDAAPEYRELFAATFGIPDSEGGPVTVGALSKALAMYIRSLARWDSPFDRYVRGETEFLDPAAKRGFNLFMGKAACATCHFPPSFGGIVPPRYIETESEVLGVPERFPSTTLRLDGDVGRGMIHFNPIFQHAFKTPTVRNVELTAPYMHNGGMETLEDVMDFYNAGGGQGLGLDVPNQTLPPDSLGLTKLEISDIIVFMKALTDTTGYGSHGLRDAAGY